MEDTLEMPIRKIDPSLHLGLHELANCREGRGSFCFQLGFAKEQAEDILSHLETLVEDTSKKAPMRECCFRLNRPTDTQPELEESKWERAMHKKWGPESSGEYVPFCKRIQTYQYPLQASRKDKCWGKIDLLGIGADFLPVPNELKKPNSDESPLRMLVQAAAYGIAIRQVWPNLRGHWIEAVKCYAPPRFQLTLDKVTLICVAPEEYWSRCLGLETKQGKFPSQAWPPFWKLVDALGEWFDIHFVAVEGNRADTAGLLTITGAQEFDLRFKSGY